MSRVYIPPSAMPMVARDVQADAPHTSAHEMSLSRNTLGLWYGAQPTRRHWLTGTPFLRFNWTSSTDVLLLDPSDDTEVQFPWCAHPAAVAIEADVYLSCGVEDRFQIRLETVQMADAMSTVEGPYSIMSAQASSFPLPNNSWGLNAQAAGGSFIRHFHVSTTISPPSSRRFALQLRGLWDGAFGVSGSAVYAYLHSMYATDVLKVPT